MRVVKGVAAALLLAGAVQAETEIIERDGDQVVVESVAEYAMGEGESVEDGREGAREKALQSATEMVGGWVRSESLVEQGELKDTTVRTLTATRLSGEIVDDSLTVRDGVPHMRVTYRATLDTSELEDWTEALADQEELRSDIELLERRNTRLLEELKEIEEQVAAGEATADAIERRRKLVERVERNQGRVSMTFDESLGAKEEREAETYSEIRERIDDYFWKAMADSVRVEILDVRTEPGRSYRDESKVRILYELAYDDQAREALQWLQQHAHMALGSFEDPGEHLAVVRPDGGREVDAEFRERFNEAFGGGFLGEESRPEPGESEQEGRLEVFDENAEASRAAFEEEFNAVKERINEHAPGQWEQRAGNEPEPDREPARDHEGQTPEEARAEARAEAREKLEGVHERAREDLEAAREEYKQRMADSGIVDSTDWDKPHGREIAENLVGGGVTIWFKEDSPGYSKAKFVRLATQPDLHDASTPGERERAVNTTEFKAPGRYEAELVVDSGKIDSIEAIHAEVVAGMSNSEDTYRPGQ